MPTAYFEVRLRVRPTRHGEAELVPPEDLAALDFAYVAVEEGAEKAVIKVEADESVLDALSGAASLRRLTTDQADAVRSAYRAPKFKRVFRKVQPAPEASEKGEREPSFVVDERGERIIDTVQTVRSGFYLIDVPLAGPPLEYGVPGESLRCPTEDAPSRESEA